MPAVVAVAAIPEGAVVGPTAVVDGAIVIVVIAAAVVERDRPGVADPDAAPAIVVAAAGGHERAGRNGGTQSDGDLHVVFPIQNNLSRSPGAERRRMGDGCGKS
jgi:hypothetical protein